MFKNGQWKFLFWKKNWGHFWTLLVQNLTIFTQNQVFGHFLWNRTSDLSKASSETGDNCFESSNGSVVSVKILVLLFIYYHFYSFGIGRCRFLCFFFYLAAAERPQHCALDFFGSVAFCKSISLENFVPKDDQNLAYHTPFTGGIWKRYTVTWAQTTHLTLWPTTWSAGRSLSHFSITNRRPSTSWRVSVFWDWQFYPWYSFSLHFFVILRR